MTNPAIPMSDDDAGMKEPLDPEPRVDRTAFSVVSSFEEAEDDAYWASRTPAERMAHLEVLRRIAYGDAATGRMEKVLEIGWADWARPEQRGS
jgi:hypothetical protein